LSGGYQADLDAITAAGVVLRDTVDSLSTAATRLDSGICAAIGPGRLAGIVAGLTDDAREELTRMHDAVVDDAELVTAAARGYAEADHAAAEELIRRAGEPG
jgi:hypothetical protein